MRESPFTLISTPQSWLLPNFYSDFPERLDRPRLLCSSPASEVLTTPPNVGSAFPCLSLLPRRLKIGPSDPPAPFPLSELDDHALGYYLVAWGITLVSPSLSKPY